MTYLEAIQYLESFINYEKLPAWPYKESLKLERIKDFLQLIGKPQDSLRCIHIAGTKGKGSTCAFAAYILREAGYKVGLYTSPHLSDFRERIRILSPHSAISISPQPQDVFEGMIGEKELICLVKELKPAIEKYNRNSEYGPLSFFEVYTAIAFKYFTEKKVDFAVLETGLGGRLDATNVADPLVCAITPISYEHTQKLGNTLREIAAEKAGIIKTQNAKRKTQNLIVISAPQEEEARRVIRNRCKKAGAQLYEVGRDIIVRANAKPKGRFCGYQGLSVSGIFGRFDDLKIRLLGAHQLINAAAATGIISVLRFYGINVGIEYIRQGFSLALWPGRCEVISRDPLVVLDGCQNTASSKILKKAIKENFRYKKLILVLGISKDKDIKGICKELGGLADQIVLTSANNPRACSPEILARNFDGRPAYLTNNIREARLKAGQLAGKQDLILVCGSLFVVGEFRDDQVRP